MARGPKANQALSTQSKYSGLYVTGISYRGVFDIWDTAFRSLMCNVIFRTALTKQRRKKRSLMMKQGT